MLFRNGKSETNSEDGSLFVFFLNKLIYFNTNILQYSKKDNLLRTNEQISNIIWDNLIKRLTIESKIS